MKIQEKTKKNNEFLIENQLPLEYFNRQQSPFLIDYNQQQVLKAIYLSAAARRSDDQDL